MRQRNEVWLHSEFHFLRLIGLPFRLRESEVFEGFLAFSAQM